MFFEATKKQKYNAAASKKCSSNSISRHSQLVAIDRFKLGHS